MRGKNIFTDLIKKQDTSDKEIERICGALNKIWFQSESPNKYSIPAHEAEILIRALQLKIRI